MTGVEAIVQEISGGYALTKQKLTNHGKVLCVAVVLTWCIGFSFWFFFFPFFFYELLR